MAAPTTSGPRWRPPRHQDGGPDEIKMAAPVTRSVTPRRVSQRDHEKVASRPRARCRSSIYKGEGPLNYFRVVFYEVQNEIQSLMV